MPANEPSFSQTLRGARLGYRGHPQLKAYLCIADAPNNRFLVSIRPTGTISSRLKRGGLYRCWWEGEDPIPLIPSCQNVTNVKVACDFYVDAECHTPF